MRKFWKLATAAGAAVVVATMAGAGAAGAITAPPAGYGFDGHPDVIVGGGSDTTAKMMLTITDLYNGSAINNGCHHSGNATATTVTTVANPPGPPSGNGVFQNACDNTDEPFNLSNWDGDTVSQANPTGSGSGRNALEGVNLGHAEGSVNALSNPGTTNASVVFHAGSAMVSDTSITTGDQGKLVTVSGDANVPQPVYVGTVTAGASFLLSASQTAQKDDPYLGGSDSAAETITLSKYGCLPAGPTGGPVYDFGRSSSVAGGNSGCSYSADSTLTELGGTTFWGYAHDSVEVYGFNGNGQKLNALSNLTANQLDDIWSDHDGTNNGPLCPGSATKHFMTWGQLDSTQWPSSDPYFAAPIVPWKMNTGSGTYGTFKSYVQGATSPKDGAFDPSSNSLDPCARTLAGGSTPTNGSTFPLENDIKPLLQTPAAEGSALSSTPSSIDNPQNWINWASFGVFSAFPYTSAQTISSTTYTAFAAAINGVLPSTSLTSSYAIQRILWHVTRKGDADCPGVITSGKRVCDFTGQPGPLITGTTHDLNVTGGTTGPSGAVREFTRFICRQNATQQGLDPFTGKNYDAEITGAIVGAGFTIVPATSRTGGTRCDVQT